ncbi:MAG TPA: M12 family metallopeptidase [Flavitalea sp.]|nr:M12 family metallopeptidase [Flavitalea sp.]
MASSPKNIKLWKGGIIPYVVAGDIARIDLVYNAIREYEANTNLRFVRRHDQTDYAFIRPHAASSNVTHIGRKGGKQVINISSNYLPTYIHEIGHVIGLAHEVKRSDRDKYIIIHWENIPDDDEKESQYTLDKNTVNSEAYDYGGIMHYPGVANGNIILESVSGAPPPEDIGRAINLTSIDKDFINSLYPHPGIIRRSSSEQGAGKIGEVSIHGWAESAGEGTLTTAVRNASNKLQLISWNINELGNIVRKGAPSLNHGSASGISLTRVGNHLVGSMANGDGNLYLISWTTDYTKEADSGSLAGKASNIKILPLNNNSFVTACINASKKAVLIVWRIDSAGKFSRISDSGSGIRLKDISIAKISETNTRHIVALIGVNASGQVVIHKFNITKTGLKITLSPSNGLNLGKGSSPFSCIAQTGHLIVALSPVPNKLQLIPIAVNRLGVIRRLSGYEASVSLTLKGLKLIPRPYGVLAAACSDNNRLYLVKWQVGDNGQVKMLGNSGDEGPIIYNDDNSVIFPGLLFNGSNEAPVFDIFSLPIDNAPVYTPVKDKKGKLLIVSWDDLDGPGELYR